MSQDEYKPNSVDAVLSRVEEKLDRTLKQQEGHEARIVTLERWRYYLLGVFAAAGFGVKALWEWVKR